MSSGNYFPGPVRAVEIPKDVRMIRFIHVNRQRTTGRHAAEPLPGTDPRRVRRGHVRSALTHRLSDSRIASCVNKTAVARPRDQDLHD